MENIIEGLPNWNYRQWAEAKQKMYDYEFNGRKENIKRCADDKLEAYYKICCEEGYSKRYEIEAELRSRGLSSIIGKYGPKAQPQQTQQPKPNPQPQQQPSTSIADKISADDFSTDKVKMVKQAESSGNAKYLIDYSMTLTGSIKAVFCFLLIAIILKSTKVIQELTQFLTVNAGMKQDELRDTAKVVMSNSQITDQLFRAIKEANESLKEDGKDLEEKVEKHDTLNPKLFDGAILKDEVREKILEIVDKFTEDLEEDGVRIVISDIVLIGSNVSYNYNSKSDLDIHIIADTSSLNCPDNLYPLLYSAYRSLFNKRFDDINFYGIPVELFVEAGDVPTVSNGIYSVKDNEWIKEPVLTDIPDIDQKELDARVKEWSDRAEKIQDDILTDKVDPHVGYEQIVKYIEDVYELRKKGLTTTGEYGLENLTFKELRNDEVLDDLKDLKNRVTARMLSLESLHEELEERQRREYANTLSRTARTQVILQPNGYFFAYNIKDEDVNYIVRALEMLEFVEYARRGAAGRFDFSHIHPGTLPTRMYTVEGKIKC